MCKSLNLSFQSLSRESQRGIHLMAASLASGSILSRMRSTGSAGASHSPSPAKGVLSDALLARPSSVNQSLVVKIGQRQRPAERTSDARLRPLGFRPVDLEPAESEQILVGHTIDLDGRRGMPRRRRLGCGVSSPWSTPPTPRCARRNWTFFLPPHLPPAGVKPWPRPVIF